MTKMTYFLSEPGVLRYHRWGYYELLGLPSTWSGIVYSGFLNPCFYSIEAAGMTSRSSMKVYHSGTIIPETGLEGHPAFCDPTNLPGLGDSGTTTDFEARIDVGA